MRPVYHCLVLHAHLPYVRHPEHPRCDEERWLFEALTETYLPLLQLLERGAARGWRHCLTLSLSPTLLSMLADPLLQQRYRDHLGRLRTLAARECLRTRRDPAQQALARHYRQRLAATAVAYDRRYGGDLITPLAGLHRAGVIELITTAATHAYLPLLAEDPASVRAQISLGIATFERLTGIRPRGFWLPECGYYPGLEAPLAACGIDYCLLETHGLTGATPAPRYGGAMPARCANGVAVLARDPATSAQVWSRTEGYPGAPDYREFHRDIGFDLPRERLAPVRDAADPPGFTGLKYHRITGATEAKALYRPDVAAQRVARDAAHFVHSCQGRAAAARAGSAPAPMLVSPYDAELFGHWWYEGVDWLEAVLGQLAAPAAAEVLSLTTPTRYLADHGEALQTLAPALSSWGEGGYHAVWLNPRNDWIQPSLQAAGQRMRALAREFADVDAADWRARALRQAACSLLLAQASDWPFMLHTGSGADYARGRVESHLARFHFLDQALGRGELAPADLQALEQVQPIFPEAGPALYADAPGSALSFNPEEVSRPCMS